MDEIGVELDHVIEKDDGQELDALALLLLLEETIEGMKSSKHKKQPPNLAGLYKRDNYKT